MVYITNDDLQSMIKTDMLTSSIDNLTEVLSQTELLVIDEVKAYLASAYKVDEIFTESKTIRNGLLVKVICMLVIYRCIRRNAARKVPEDIALLEENAYNLLDNIASGRLSLTGLPKVTNDDGTSKLLYGNSRKAENYI